MKLYIAEKPSLGRAIAAVLPTPHRKGEGCIWVGEGDCVSWCIGHLLEQAEPEAYNPQYKKWNEQDLPIIPEQWQLKAKPNTRKQLAVLRGLVKQSTQIIHAGDPDREGQLLVDEVIHFLGVKGSKLTNIQRLLVSDLNPSAVKKSLSQLRSNRDFIPLSVSALARSRADWLYGINLTRASTLQGQKVGYQGVLSVGRVQTPLLGLVVRRDKDIQSFVSKPFYEVLALLHLQHNGLPKEQIFTAKWLPSEACQDYMDEENRVVSAALADNVVRRIAGQPAVVDSVLNKPKSQAPPLTYNLSSLQIDAAKRFAMSAKQVLDSCQSLYERHKLITYPRSDCRYLPAAHHRDAAKIVKAISTVSNHLETVINDADLSLKSKVWNDKKVDAHHAIIPTAKSMNSASLSSSELKVYELISRQYLLQFYSSHQWIETSVGLTIAGGKFSAKAKVIKAMGWKAVFASDNSNKNPKNNNQNSDNSDSENISPHLPPLTKGQSIHCLSGERIDKNTQPPKPFTDATLLSAMTGISRYVMDKELKKVLKETDGIGTEATRASIIELLFSRGFLTRQGKNIHATDAGKGLINSLPDSTTHPDMTARWERVLNNIVDRKADYNDFMGSMIPTLKQLVEQNFSALPVSLKGIKAKSPAFKKRRTKTAGKKLRQSPSSKKVKKKSFTKPKKSAVC